MRISRKIVYVRRRKRDLPNPIDFDFDENTIYLYIADWTSGATSVIRIRNNREKSQIAFGGATRRHTRWPTRQSKYIMCVCSIVIGLMISSGFIDEKKSGGYNINYIIIIYFNSLSTNILIACVGARTMFSGIVEETWYDIFIYLKKIHEMFFFAYFKKKKNVH